MNILFANEDESQRIIDSLSREVTVKDLGIVKPLSGIDIEFEKNCYYLTQKKDDCCTS